MPFELMDSRGVSASSHFYEDNHFPERQVGFWKSKAMSDRQGSKSVASSPLEKNSAIGAQNMELPDTYVARDLKENLGVSEATKTSWKSLDRPLRSWSNLSMQPESYSLDGMKFDINGTHHESSLFSCSLSEVFNRKMRLPGTILRPPPTNSFAPLAFSL